MPDLCKNRERVLASGTADVPGLPIGAIRGGYLCFRCFGPSEKIQKCSGCKRAGYCSKECQKLDWSICHNRHCKILQKVNELEEQQYQEKRTWEQYRTQLLNTARGVKESAPNEDRLDIVVQAQPYCITCRRTAVQLSSRKIPLKPCPECRLVFSCAECPFPPAHSASVCSAYQNQAGIEQFRIFFFEDMGHASVGNVACTQKPRDKRILLKTSPGWWDYFQNNFPDHKIDHMIKEDFSGLTDMVMKYGNAEEREDFVRMRHFLMSATDVLTMPLTIIAALEDLSLDKPHLNIHIVGATGRELISLRLFEELLHQVPGIKSLGITAVGPSSLEGLNGQAFRPKMSLPCCPICSSAGRSRSISSYRGVYHDFVKTSNYSKPDLVVLFNSGWIDGDDSESHWRPTIELLVESDVPALFTTYNADEARNEKAVLTALGARFLVPPEQNKWRGLVPVPEFLDVEFDMWFQNSHWYIIQGQQK